MKYWLCSKKPDQSEVLRDLNESWRVFRIISSSSLRLAPGERLEVVAISWSLAQGSLEGQCLSHNYGRAIAKTMAIIATKRANTATIAIITSVRIALPHA